MMAMGLYVSFVFRSRFRIWRMVAMFLTLVCVSQKTLSFIDDFVFFFRLLAHFLSAFDQSLLCVVS